MVQIGTNGDLKDLGGKSSILFVYPTALFRCVYIGDELTSLAHLVSLGAFVEADTANLGGRVTMRPVWFEWIVSTLGSRRHRVFLSLSYGVNISKIR